MNISKADALAHLGKWYKASTEVRAIYRCVAGNLWLVGKIEELSSSAIRVTAIGSEMRFYFRDTSEYEYKDVRQAPDEIKKDRVNKYPIFIEVAFSNGDHLEVCEFFKE
jgi:hypothetical protein